METEYRRLLLSSVSSHKRIRYEICEEVSDEDIVSYYTQMSGAGEAVDRCVVYEYLAHNDILVCEGADGLLFDYLDRRGDGVIALGEFALGFGGIGKETHVMRKGIGNGGMDRVVREICEELLRLDRIKAEVYESKDCCLEELYRWISDEEGKVTVDSVEAFMGEDVEVDECFEVYSYIMRDSVEREYGTIKDIRLCITPILRSHDQTSNLVLFDVMRMNYLTNNNTDHRIDNIERNNDGNKIYNDDHIYDDSSMRHLDTNNNRKNTDEKEDVEEEDNYTIRKKMNDTPKENRIKVDQILDWQTPRNTLMTKRKSSMLEGLQPVKPNPNALQATTKLSSPVSDWRESPLRGSPETDRKATRRLRDHRNPYTISSSRANLQDKNNRLFEQGFASSRHPSTIEMYNTTHSTAHHLNRPLRKHSPENRLRTAITANRQSSAYAFASNRVHYPEHASEPAQPSPLSQKQISQTQGDRNLKKKRMILSGEGADGKANNGARYTVQSYSRYCYRYTSYTHI